MSKAFILQNFFYLFFLLIFGSTFFRGKAVEFKYITYSSHLCYHNMAKLL